MYFSLAKHSFVSVGNKHFHEHVRDLEFAGGWREELLQHFNCPLEELRMVF